MSAPGTWVTVMVKVAKDETNEADPWVAPTHAEVASEVRQRMEGVDLDTGWTIVSVSS